VRAERPSSSGTYYSETCKLRVKVKDVNDIPVIQNEPQTDREVEEGTPTGALVNVRGAGAPQPIGVIDNDNGEEITWSIQSGASDGALKVHSCTGDIQVADGTKLD